MYILVAITFGLPLVLAAMLLPARMVDALIAYGRSRRYAETTVFAIIYLAIFFTLTSVWGIGAMIKVMTHV